MSHENANKVILLVEDNPDDRDLTLLAFKEADILNEVVICSDGEEALEFLFATGAHAGRDTRVMPEVADRTQQRALPYILASSRLFSMPR